MATVAPADPELLAGVLSEIADITSETIELREVFPRVATAVRRIIPFDNMGVVRLLHGDRVVLHATTVPDCGEKCSGPMELSAWSPRWRPHPGPRYRIDDAKAELDPAYPMDAMVIEGGMGSGLWEPFKHSGSFGGGVWLCADATQAFTDEHQEVLRPIASLLGSAIEHWRIWDKEQRRRDRLDRMETLLGTMAESLDVREVFQRLSDGMQRIIPHHLMVLTELDLKSRTIRVSAHGGPLGLVPPVDAVTLTEEELGRRIDFEVIRDIQTEIVPRTERERLIVSSGLKSWLRVPVWLSGEVQGSLGFFHQDASQYQWEDAEIAARLADRLALSLSLHRLAEEARIAAEARESAERLAATVETLTHELESRRRGRVVGVSPSWKDTLVAVGRVAPSETNVLITGESGTGKEVVSNLIHQGSARNGKPFIAINAAALPEQLLESELFGHERGAFTGAVTTKIGRIEQAEGGTLFLDEIAEMSPTVQAKLLRVLEEREFQRVGGTRTLKANVRLIAATNRDLAAGIARRTFREDLYYRLNVFQIHIAPLRNRREDILPLAEIFLQELGRSMARPAGGISRDAREWLLTYHWPGNVRELRNAIERAILLCDGGLITRDHLPTPMVLPQALPVAQAPEAAAPHHGPGNGSGNGVHAPVAPPGAEEDLNLSSVERGLLEKALAQSKGNKSKAARILGLSRAQLYWRLEKYGLR